MYGDNIFGIVGDAIRQLKRAGLRDKAKELPIKINKTKSYDEACALVDKYLEAIPEKDADKEWDEYWGEDAKNGE